VHFHDVRRSLTRTYLTFDGRSLALGRVVLAAVLMVDVLRRIRWLRDFYSNEGLLPNHTVLWQPFQPRAFSFFLMASHPEESAVGFVIAFCCFSCLLVGFRTRLFHVLSFVMTTSLHSRILFAENGGAVALGAVVFWTAFLPLGRRFSVDALLSSLRARPDETPRDLAPSRRPVADARPIVSLAVLALLLQLGVIYAFNYVHKSGMTWRTGTAVHYVLEQERIVTWIGLWARHHLPFAATLGLTYGTLVIEASAPFLILSPFFRPLCRALAIGLLTALHGGIGLMVNLGIFSAAMIAYYPFLVDTAHWEWLATRTRGRKREVFYDAGCGVCFQIVRVLARLDSRHRLTWISNREEGALPAGVDPALLERTILVLDPTTGRRWTRGDAVAEIVASLPFGRLGAWVLLVPGLRAGAGYLYDALARRRTAISLWWGFAACSIAEPALDDTASRTSGSPVAGTPFGAFRRAQAPRLRELGVAFALFVAAADLSVSNGALPEAWRWTSRPAWMAAAVMYTHVAEGWGMFSPDAPIYDEMVVVDAVTRDGRHVDPYNEAGSRVHALPVNDIPERLGHDSFFCDYTLRIPGAGAYHQALSEWIQRYAERTGYPGDTIVSFEAFKLEHTPPGPGETRPTNVRRTMFLRWPDAPAK
jgi:predicted DCC family thiol-disulfide oxidoreductase YuxK